MTETRQKRKPPTFHLWKSKTATWGLASTGEDGGEKHPNHAERNEDENQYSEGAFHMQIGYQRLTSNAR